MRGFKQSCADWVRPYRPPWVRSYENRIKQWVLPPIFADAGETRTARILYSVLLITIAASFCFGGVAGLFYQVPATAFGAMVLVGAIALVALTLLRKGHGRVAGQFFLLLAWAALTVSPFFLSGSAPAVACGQLTVVVLARLLLGRRALLWFAGLAILAVGTHAYVASAAAPLPASSTVPVWGVAGFLVAVCVVVTALDIAVTGFEQARDRARQSGGTPVSLRREASGAPIAVVFGTYNRLELLKKAVASVRLAAQGTAADIIIVDGGSTDGSREWAAGERDVILLGQRGPLTGAVGAFNLGFGYAVDHGYPFVAHLNDDAEFVTEGALALAKQLLEQQSNVGEVAFELDARGAWGFETVHGQPYANFGLVRLAAGIAVAQAQGDPSGRNWWNPIYRTYGADSEFGCWLWKLGWRVHTAPGWRVHDVGAQDELRALNAGDDPDREDSAVFWSRWCGPSSLRPEAANVAWHGAKVHLGCGDKRMDGWINVDGIRTPATDVVMDFAAAIRSIPSGSWERVYWAHGPEHIHPDLLPALLREIHRVLRPGGKLTVATIDLSKIYEHRYASHEDGDQWNPALYGDSDSNHHPFLTHKLCFDRATLTHYLEAAGFHAVQPWVPEDYPDILALNDYAVSCRLVTVHLEGSA